MTEPYDKVDEEDTERHFLMYARERQWDNLPVPPERLIFEKALVDEFQHLIYLHDSNCEL